jgi:hypothetical protein
MSSIRGDGQAGRLDRAAVAVLRLRGVRRRRGVALAVAVCLHLLPGLALLSYHRSTPSAAVTEPVIQIELVRAQAPPMPVSDLSEGPRQVEAVASSVPPRQRNRSGCENSETSSNSLRRSSGPLSRRRLSRRRRRRPPLLRLRVRRRSRRRRLRLRRRGRGGCSPIWRSTRRFRPPPRRAVSRASSISVSKWIEPAGFSKHVSSGDPGMRFWIEPPWPCRPVLNLYRRRRPRCQAIRWSW